MTVTKQKSSSAYNEANKAYLKSELRCITKNGGGGGGGGAGSVGTAKLANPNSPTSKPIAKQRLSFGDDEDCCSSGGDEDIVTEVRRRNSNSSSSNNNSHPKSVKKSLESVQEEEADHQQSHNIKQSSSSTTSSSSSSLLSSLLSTKPLCDSISDALLVFGDLSCGDDNDKEEDSSAQAHHQKGKSMSSGSDNNNSFNNEPMHQDKTREEEVRVLELEPVDHHHHHEHDNDDNPANNNYCELEEMDEEEDLSCEDDSEGSSARSTTSGDDEGENSHPAMDEDDNDDNRDKLFCTEHIGNVLLDEFDGTTVLCRVCGDKASGFHYGVHSCEGCKGFFRRSIQQKIQYRPCTKNQQCSILRVNRNRCQYCRLKKCIAVGMSRDAVRFGRVPKREKAKILAAMQQSHHAKVSERALSAELEDTSKLTSAVVRAHMETCEFTKDKVQKCYNTALIKKEEGTTKPRIGQNTEITLACPLNPHPQSTTEDFSQRFSPAIRGVVEFAKRLPGFSIMSQDDQVTLLKAGVFEILLVRLACMFKGNTMLCINGELLERETISAHQNARFLLDSMFKFAEQFNKLGLSDEQIGLFCAVVVMAPDRPGLRNVELVTRLQSHFRSALHSLVPAYVVQELDRKIPDLRTLNTLHSEKLLAFKMEEQSAFEQQQHQQPQIPRSSSVERMDTSNTPPYEHMHHHHHQDSSSSSSSTSSNTVSISPRRLSNNSSNGSCPYKSFQRGLESPSGDSGIESGACSSPARSEQDLPLIEERGREHHGHQRMEDMPVLKRALQAPPIVDTNVLMNEAYRVHKKFRYSITDKHSSSSSTSSTPTPPTYSSSTSSTSSSPPPPPSPSHTYSPSISPYRPQSHALQPAHTPQTSLSPPPPPPHQLYPQLASALTNPRSSSSSSSGSSSGDYHHHHPIHHHPHQFKSPLQLQHSTLAMKLNEKPKHMTEDQQVTSELLHSIIMRGGADDDDVEDEIVRRGQQQQQTQQQSQSSSDSSQVPLNLSKKIAC